MTGERKPRGAMSREAALAILSMYVRTGMHVHPRSRARLFVAIGRLTVEEREHLRGLAAARDARVWMVEQQEQEMARFAERMRKQMGLES